MVKRKTDSEISLPTQLLLSSFFKDSHEKIKRSFLSNINQGNISSYLPWSQLITSRVFSQQHQITKWNQLTVCPKSPIPGFIHRAKQIHYYRELYREGQPLQPSHNSTSPLNFTRDERKHTVHLQNGLNHQEGLKACPNRDPESITFPTVLICQGHSIRVNYIIQHFLMPRITMIHFLNSWYHWAFRGSAKSPTFIQKGFQYYSTKLNRIYVWVTNIENYYCNFVVTA